MFFFYSLFLLDLGMLGYFNYCFFSPNKFKKHLDECACIK